MKKIIVNLLLVVVIILISAIKVNAIDTITKINVEQEENVYNLEELVKDEKEQDKIKKQAEKNAQEIEEKNKLESENIQKAVLATNDVLYKNQYGTYIKGVTNPGYDYYLEEQTSQNTKTNKTTSYFKIKKHDVMNNTDKIIYDATNDNAHYITYHVRDNIIYVLYITNYDMNNSWGTEYSTSYIVGIDVKTEKVIMKQSFESPQDCGYFPSFAVDGEKRVYLVYKKRGIRIFDKNGKLLYDQKPFEDSEGKNFIYIKGISPNNKIMFFEAMYMINEYAYAQSVYEGMQKLDNGVFTYKKSYTVYGRTYPNNYSYNPIWYFFNNDYAVDQYGRIAKFNYNVTDKEMGVDRKIVLDLNSGLVDYTYSSPVYPNVCQNGDYLYIVGANRNIYKVNKKTLTYTEYIKTDIEDYEDVKSINYYEQSIFMLTRTSWNYEMKQIQLTSSNITKLKDITISNHSSTKHSMDDIKNKYQKTSPTFNYTNSIYVKNPSWKNPYSAGSLKNGVITDTLNRLNYYRWLVGVNEITVNTAKLDRNQKGAVISKANNEISHYPSQPSDMSNEFYKEAYAGCNAGYTQGDIYSGNVSYGEKIPYQAIEGFVDDLNNITIGSKTGHRQSMLDPKATSISFGQCDIYTTASVYYDPNKDISKERYYAYPSAGYFPKNEMKIGQYWSIYFVGNVSGTVTVTFTYKGKKYSAVGLTFESGSNALSFAMPSDLQNLLGGSNKTMPESEISVEINGLKDENLNKLTYKYSVRFFNVNTALPFSDVNQNDWHYSAVKYAYQNKIVSGTTDTTFSPDMKITRGMLVTMLYKMEGSPKVSGSSKFPDVQDSKMYYYKAVIWASTNKIVNGYSSGTNKGKFVPDNNITREELAAMLKNYCIYKKKYKATKADYSKFSDKSKISSWALSAMDWAIGNSVITGSNGKVNPLGTATRAEAVSMLYKYKKSIK